MAFHQLRLCCELVLCTVVMGQRPQSPTISQGRFSCSSRLPYIKATLPLLTVCHGVAAGVGLTNYKYSHPYYRTTPNNWGPRAALKCIE
ncbi:hypothetical protein F5Y15DRAFT_396872 [Xylariaceae sp. FL0016]|nr:hypothetical protein F5Y15DRAFT_396872 [Xylariaceae sp. FL0016]